MNAVPQLHSYQRVAVDHLQRNPRAGLFLDMGLGKTAVTLSALRPEDLPALVIAPKRVATEVWPVEAKKWRPDLTLEVADGSPQQRARVLFGSADIVAISRDSLSSLDQLSRYRKYRTLIIDELSGFKSRQSARWKAVKVLSSSMTNVWGLTGTPSPNGLMDLWAQIHILDNGARLGRTITGFRNRYFISGKRLPNGTVIEWILRENADKKIHKLLEDICLSMSTEGLIELPPVTFNHVPVPLPPAVRRTYRDMKKELVAGIDILGAPIFTAATASVLSSKLSQISAGFLYTDPDETVPQETYVLHREKMRALQEIVDGTGSPVLVFYRFRAELEMIKETLGDLAHTIDEPGVVTRWNAGDIPVLVTHPASAGHGLNLQYGGHTIVWTSIPWSLEEWQQANKRLARQGQTERVMVHLLMARGTIDSKIYDRLLGKTSVQDALLAHLESPL